eukprot:TRINITY_DN778106_c0_g1_i1.p2 TRINITY_DN778106_c0_g1~~TRINITY_DN778106_c0_g1_i1.p2  ORF type:complete len:165 (-),score=19.56 TRINITY_DN778106_c0_g1_i1:79-573(-)
MKKIINLLLLISLPISLLAHSLVLSVFDNEDGTLTASGMFNTGESAAGAIVKLESNSGEILYEKRLPDEGELTINIPSTPYKVILEGGPGHVAIKDGIPPKGGFKAESVKKETKKVKKPTRTDMTVSTSKAVTISIVLAFILLFATIIVSIRNTNKLLTNLNNK